MSQLKSNVKNDKSEKNSLTVPNNTLEVGVSSLKWKVYCGIHIGRLADDVQVKFDKWENHIKSEKNVNMMNERYLNFI